MATGKNSLPRIIKELKKIRRSKIIAGVLAPEDSEQAIIAGANEFGATINVTKAVRGALMAQLIEADAKDLIKMIPAIGAVINIPARSYIRSTFNDPKTVDKAIDFIKFGIDRIIQGTGDAEAALKGAASSVVSSIQLKLRSDIQPENHPITVAIKGSSGTLRDKGRLVQSISARIEGEVNSEVAA